MNKKNILITGGIIVSVILVIILLLIKNCQGLEILRLHDGKTTFSIVNNKGDNIHEPPNCANLIIHATE